MHIFIANIVSQTIPLSQTGVYALHIPWWPQQVIVCCHTFDGWNIPYNSIGTLNIQSNSEELQNVIHVYALQPAQNECTNEAVLSHFVDLVHKRSSFLDCIYTCKDGPKKLQYAVAQLMDGIQQATVGLHRLYFKHSTKF